MRLPKKYMKKGGKWNSHSPTQSLEGKRDMLKWLKDKSSYPLKETWKPYVHPNQWGHYEPSNISVTTHCSLWKAQGKNFTALSVIVDLYSLPCSLKRRQTVNNLRTIPHFHYPKHPRNNMVSIFPFSFQSSNCYPCELLTTL